MDAKRHVGGRGLIDGVWLSAAVITALATVVVVVVAIFVERIATAPVACFASLDIAHIAVTPIQVHFPSLSVEQRSCLHRGGRTCDRRRRRIRWIYVGTSNCSPGRISLGISGCARAKPLGEK